MSRALKVAHEDAEAMRASRIRKHLMSDEPGLAQKVLAEAVGRRRDRARRRAAPEAPGTAEGEAQSAEELRA